MSANQLEGHKVQLVREKTQGNWSTVYYLTQRWETVIVNKVVVLFLTDIIQVTLHEHITNALHDCTHKNGNATNTSGSITVLSSLEFLQAM